MAGARVSRMTSAASKHSTVITTPLPALNKFDILLTEQISLVKNAQEGLRQSLALFSKASSKEEKESARLQVQSLMSRAQELVTTLQIVMKIHRELIFAQRDLMEVKQAEKPHKSHYHRVHWLEQRLERLLIARRRGRPAARGRRQARIRDIVADKPELPSYGFTCSGQVSHTPTDVPLKTNTSFGTPSIPSSPAPTSNSPQRDSILPSSTAHRIPSKAAHRSPSKASSPFPLPHLPQQPHGGSSFSSRRSPSKDSRESDVWHSESEANWTIQLSNVNPTKDITQSQVLSSADEVALLDTQRHTSSPSGVHSTAPSEPTYPLPRKTSDLRESVQHSEKQSKANKLNQNTSETLYGFEPPRPAEVFGSSSWNTLSLAVNSNFVQNDTPDNQCSVSLVCDVKNLETGLDQVCNELLFLRRLVMTTAKAATVEGRPLPEITSHTLQSFPALPVEDSLHVKLRKDVESPLEGCAEESPVELPPMSTLQTSRKVYGKKGDIATFPRPTTIWSPTKPGFSPCTKHIRSHTVSQSSHMRRSPVRMRSKSALTSDTQAKLDNIFDADRLHKQRIEFLLETLDSSCVKTRRNSAQALGCLPQADIFQVRHKLTKLLEDHDTIVRYLALKSLLSLGETSRSVKEITNKVLSEGSPYVQCDLLQLINNLALKEPQMEWNWCQVSVTKLLSSSFPEVALLAAMLLSNCQLERDTCVTTLLTYLSSTNPTWRDQAMHRLVKCWNHTSPEIVNAALSQLRSCSNWKLRLSAVQLLEAIGKDIQSMNGSIFDILVKRIANEPIQTVKQAIGVLLADLDMEKRAQSFFLGRLESADETVRAEAAIALRAFELRSSRIAQVLLDYFELDPSSYVRIQLVKTLALVKYCSPVVLQRLAEKCKGSGQVARECSAVLILLKKKFGLLDEE